MIHCALNGRQLGANFNKQLIFCRRESRNVAVTVRDCRRFTASTLWICVIFSHGKVMDNQC